MPAVSCRKCAAELPENAHFCLQCGEPIKNPSLNVVNDSARQPLPRRRSRHWGRTFVLLLLLAFFFAFTWAVTSHNPFAQGVQQMLGSQHDQTILDTPFSVAAHNFRFYKFSLPEGSRSVSVEGEFAASADRHNGTDKGTDNDIEVFILSEDAFAVWQNGYTTSSIFSSGRASHGSVQADFPAGQGIYYLVFSNKFDPKAAKKVNATVRLLYASWLPPPVRHITDRFWNWLGV